MGRVKLPIIKIENLTNRQVTYSKRKNGLLKKAYEMSILCDIHMALIMFSPSGRLSHYSGKKRIEDILLQYINLPDKERGCIIKNKQSLICTLGKLQMETELTNERITPAGHKRQAEMQQQELRKEILDLQQQLNIAEAKLRAFEPDIRKLASFNELEACQHRLVEALGRVRQTKNDLESPCSALEASYSWANGLKNPCPVVYPRLQDLESSASALAAPPYPESPCSIAADELTFQRHP